MAIEKIKILGAVLELSAKLHYQFSQFFEVNGLDWQFCFAGMYYPYQMENEIKLSGIFFSLAK